jgi:Flp pilus assembly protein TadB
MTARQNDGLRPDEQSFRAQRILALDEQIASMERLDPHAGRYAAGLIYLLLLLAGVLYVVGGGAWLFLIKLFLLNVGIPAAIYGALLFQSRRRRRRLEREMDELVADQATQRLPASHAHLGAETGA